MDFYFDIGMAVILRIISDRKNAQKYYQALAKLFLALRDLGDLDAKFAAAIEAKDKRK